MMGVATMKTAVPVKAIPLLKFSLAKPGQQDYGCITASGEVLHRISNVDEFYAMLGYTEEIRKRGLLPDEFIWDRYTRDGAVMSAQCVQAHIATYLHKHSPKFREQYGHTYDMTVGTCNLDGIDVNDKDCANCSKRAPSCTESTP